MNEFEKASSDIHPHRYEMEHENVIEFEKDAKTATVTFCQGRMITKVRKMAEERPDEVQICSFKNNTIVAHMPVKYIKIGFTKNVSEEQRKAASERFRKIRETKDNY